jgi:1-acyl-sn-glycerol-3-phosphate acyltransferase
MKTIYKILLIPWAAWCILVFIILCLILLPVLVIAVLSRSERLIYAAHFAPTRLARICLFLFGIRLEIRGREHIDPKGPYIFTSNHRSLLDAVVAGASIPNYVKFLGKKEMLKWPVLGYLLDKFYVPVERNNKEDRTQSMRLVEEKLKSGASFFICPEGTCNRTDEFFTHFYNGAFRMSADTGIPLMPLTFIGSGDRWPRSEPRIYPGRLIVYYHVPIPASAFQGDNLESGKQQVIELMRQDLLKHYPSGKY